MNVVFLRNTMSRQAVRLVQLKQMPWLQVAEGRLDPESKRAVDKVFLQLGGKIFFDFVQPMKNRSKAPRRGYGELVSELVLFARKAAELAECWAGESAVEKVAAKIRRIPGFGGKGFRCKEIILDLHEVTGREYPNISEQLVDWSTVGPGPRRVLNFINNRPWTEKCKPPSLF